MYVTITSEALSTCASCVCVSQSRQTAITVHGQLGQPPKGKIKIESESFVEHNMSAISRVAVAGAPL